jgi:hypothetical protein
MTISRAFRTNVIFGTGSLQPLQIDSIWEILGFEAGLN